MLLLNSPASPEEIENTCLYFPVGGDMNNYFKNRDSAKGSVNIIKQVKSNIDSFKLA